MKEKYISKEQIIIICTGVLLVLVHYYLVFNSGFRTWGFHIIEYYSIPVRILYYIVGIIIVFSAAMIASKIKKIESRSSLIKTHLRSHKVICISLLLIVCYLLFWIFRVKYPFLGDGLNSVNGYVLTDNKRYALGLYHYLYVLLSVRTYPFTL